MTLTLPASTYRLSGLSRLEYSISRPIIRELSRHSFSSLALYTKILKYIGIVIKYLN